MTTYEWICFTKGFILGAMFGIGLVGLVSATYLVLAAIP